MIKSKKAQVQSMAPAILALVFAAIVLVFGLIISQSLRETETVRTSEKGSVVNETLTQVTDLVAQEVNISSLPAFELGTGSVIMRNATEGNIIDASNYTVFSNGTVVTSAAGTAGDWNGSDMKISYSHTSGGPAYDSANKTVVGLGTFADFWEIIVLAIVITVVIGLLLVVFGGRQRR